MLVIAGLGNPGAQYTRNRHNIGFMAVDAIAGERRFGPFRARHQGLMADGLIGDERVMLLKPQTYMNDSGRSVGEALRYAKLDLGALVVIHDELDLAPAKVRVKVGGGDAGHNGCARSPPMWAPATSGCGSASAIRATRRSSIIMS